MMYWPSDMQQWPLFHKLSLRIDLMLCTQWQGIWIFVKSAQWMEGYTNPSFQHRSVHRLWALLRAEVIRLFLSIPDNQFGWDWLKKCSFWATSTPTWRFSFLWSAVFDLFTSTTQELTVLQCKKSRLVGAWIALRDYSLHFLNHYVCFCPLWKISPLMVRIM